jgi:hypothetical protein
VTSCADCDRIIDSPTANLYEAPIQIPVVGASWDNEDQANGCVAQLYGGYVLPGSRLDMPGGVGLIVSQWNTATGWPYRAMQFKATLTDTTEMARDGTDPIDLAERSKLLDTPVTVGQVSGLN